MTKQQFFEAFVAALRSEGETTVITDRDLHHSSFAAAVRVLKDARDAGQAEARSLPRGLIGDEITGRFPELDFALASLQFPKLTGSQNPRYRQVNITLDKSTADEILALYPADQQALIKRMARVFTERGAAIAH